LDVKNYLADTGNEAARHANNTVNVAINKTTLTAAPNPAASSTVVYFSLNQNTTADMYLTDALGNKVLNVFAQRIFAPGDHYENIKLTSLTPGMYFVHFKTDTEIQTVKIVVTKK
jgi:hypothetical protein